MPLLRLQQIEKHPNTLQYYFVPFAFKTLDPVNQDGLAVINLLGYQLAQIAEDNIKKTFCFWSLSMAILHGHSAAGPLSGMAFLYM